MSHLIITQYRNIQEWTFLIWTIDNGVLKTNVLRGVHHIDPSSFISTTENQQLTICTDTPGMNTLSGSYYFPFLKCIYDKHHKALLVKRWGAFDKLFALHKSVKCYSESVFLFFICQPATWHLSGNLMICCWNWEELDYDQVQSSP